MNVLIACEFSGAVRDAFRDLGHEAWSCDLEHVEPEGKYTNYHLFGNCFDWLDGLTSDTKWDLLIAHPPCTYLCISGNKWMREGSKRHQKRIDAINFFWSLLIAPVSRVAIENPISIVSTVIKKPDQIVQPWMFGHGETKATCLWLNNLPLLKPTSQVKGREARVHRMAPSPDRSKERGRTYSGIAQAMAEQWGCLREDQKFVSGSEPILDPFD